MRKGLSFNHLLDSRGIHRDTQHACSPGSFYSAGEAGLEIETGYCNQNGLVQNTSGSRFWTDYSLPVRRDVAVFINERDTTWAKRSIRELALRI
jgi:hypothetical protein